MTVSAAYGTRFYLPRLMGHRGAAALAPENTLAGLRVATDQGLTWVEFDVMLTRDGVPVLHHDDNLKRTTGRAEDVAALDFAALHDVDAGRGFHPDFSGETVPSLEAAVEVLLACKLHPNVEIKPTPGTDVVTATRTIEVLRRSWPAELPPPLLSSFSTMSLAAARVLAPDWPLGLIVDRVPKDWRSQLQALGCVSFHINARHGTARVFQAARAAGYAVACYTVNDARRAAELLQDGADCIITDNPAALEGLAAE